MSTYTWTIPTGNIINGSTYIKDTDNKIQDTIDDLADFVNSSGSYANQGLMFDYVNKASNQTITGVKTFSNGIVSNVTGNVTGNSGTTTKLATARTITLAGDVTGSLSFDGSANTSMTATIADNSHSHTIANVTSLQAALDGKLSTSGNATTATTATNAIYATTQTAGTNNTTIATTAFVMANSSNTLADLGVTATATHLNYINTLSSNAQTQLNGKANLASPSLTGAPTAPTPATGDNSTKIATTAFVLANSIQDAQFAQSVAVNGYQKLPSGLIMQWGTFISNGSSGLGSPQIVSFPVAFASNVYYIGISDDGGYTGGVELGQVDWTTAGKTTLVQMGVYTNYIGTVKYFAIGK